MPLTPVLSALGWTLLSFLGFAAVFFFLVWPIGQLQSAGADHAATLGVWALAWVLASGAWALLAGRVTLGAWLAIRPIAGVILVAGALISAADIWLLAGWAIARYGYSDPEYIGPMIALFALVGGVAVAGFAIQIAPRWAVWSPLLAMLGGGLLGAYVVLQSLPGLSDGLAKDSGPLAVVTVAATVYVAVVGLASLARLRGSPQATRYSTDQPHGVAPR
jgi:hypothetical protein